MEKKKYTMDYGKGKRIHISHCFLTGDALCTVVYVNGVGCTLSVSSITAVRGSLVEAERSECFQLCSVLLSQIHDQVKTRTALYCNSRSLSVVWNCTKIFFVYTFQ
jgi:hypothetical protein